MDNTIFVGLTVVDLTRSTLAGVISGIFMVIISDSLYRLKIFKSSLLLIDGWFFIRSINIEGSNTISYLAGIPIHIFTSAVFGGIYLVIIRIFKLNPLTPSLIIFYFFVLWISMIFIALPLAGQGFMGKRLHRSTWVEQLFLHISFGIGFLIAMKALF